HRDRQAPAGQAGAGPALLAATVRGTRPFGVRLIDALTTRGCLLARVNRELSSAPRERMSAIGAGGAGVAWRSGRLPLPWWPRGLWGRRLAPGRHGRIGQDLRIAGGGPRAA